MVFPAPDNRIAIADLIIGGLMVTEVNDQAERPNVPAIRKRAPFGWPVDVVGSVRGGG